VFTGVGKVLMKMGISGAGIQLHIPNLQKAGKFHAKGMMKEKTQKIGKA